MADINSLINPPTEEEDEYLPSDDGRSGSVAGNGIKTEEIKTEPEPETAVAADDSLSSFDKIKTHFPAARIKKIMQSDEDIGKVAQVTPVVVGRALEIFMANLVDHAIVEAKKAGVRRIAALHIRAAVENTEQFDFLVDVVSKYQSAKN
ncbi:hypothetical protein PUMCH_001551 [Australozyma saopauloensis]|uniref:Transcription factor CBF/NF-Y/archaeal histone domain-containing protein n=1 Tax=Australozyma saopauloensis TaxID=291208 RepID=A0AAX4H727_9ASCO|nr:hypothetical protein PUMCH_001551 [[Candida] saopauloensis]